MPLRAADAKRLIRRLLEEGIYRARPHAQGEMAKDGLTDVDAANVLRGGVVNEAEYENGEWRFGVRTQRMHFVVTFEPDPATPPGDEEDLSGTEIVVVTAWRIRP
jgi:hypothetical protein